jgi:hypothetical protein
MITVLKVIWQVGEDPWMDRTKEIGTYFFTAKTTPKGVIFVLDRILRTC